MTNRLLLYTFILVTTFSFSQKEKPKNYRMFDEKFIHFGFMLGTNKGRLDVYQNEDVYEKYKLLSLTSTNIPGGQVGIVTSVKLFTPVVRFRFIPTLSFQERSLMYKYENDDESKAPIMHDERINSTNIDFPMMLQFRTLRINNFAAYCLLGFQPSIDLQSQEKATQNHVDPFIKMKKFDQQGQIGGGIELFAPYFKFGMEIKYSQSFKNTFIQDNSEIALPINNFNNRCWWFSIIFEG